MTNESKVARYTPEVVHKSVATGVSYGVAEMRERDHGTYVTYADYRALEEDRNEWKKLARTMEASLTAKEEELAAMLRQAADDCEDADRYRWLRNESKPGDGPSPALRCQDGPYFNSPISGERLDMAVDTARTPKEQTK
ncbi:MAG TPA: hypothetical protein VM621_10350 [Luteibacter sp.]|uniref:hypothetical protein n=1 Tax=Luteibacter sp. TaxID=1886636 RepID=UPI002BFEF3AB|nr:hypothetical protein [Luteibacter sp.]HVI55440.1 hypothetical protein [Luteibacter sp.]